MTSEKLKPTPGPWAFGADPCPDNATAIAICKENIDAHTKPSSGHFFVVFTPDGRRTAMVGHGPDGAANAQFIAEAGTVHHECGLSPRGLQERCSAMEAALQHCEQMLMKYAIDRVDHEAIEDEALEIIRAALAKHKEV